MRHSVLRGLNMVGSLVLGRWRSVKDRMAWCSHKGHEGCDDGLVTLYGEDCERLKARENT